ncbi:MAG: toll/interleukin-1 receptor domain-containing protein, partial [Alphaproteobacteria bacterium]
MARLFISHSSHDNAAAIALRGWLAEQGWDDVFLDLDPERGIVSGERWERALHQAASRCEAVVFLLSKRWFASGWCRREFELALRLGKRVFGVVIDATRTEDIPPEYRDTW